MDKNTKKLIIGITIIVFIMLIASISYGITSKKQKDRISELEKIVKTQEVLLKEQNVMLDEVIDTTASLKEKEQELKTCLENLKKNSIRHLVID